MLGQAVVIATEAEDEVAGLSDVDAVSDVLEEEGEALPARQRRHVALGQRQVSRERGHGVSAAVSNLQKEEKKQAAPLTSRTGTAPPTAR